MKKVIGLVGVYLLISLSIKMEKDCTYYWNKVAILHFTDDLSYNDKLEMAETKLSKDEFLHLKELLDN